MTERDDRDLTGAWALDALTESERAEFAAYLARDDDARAEATELTDTAVLLGLAVAPVPAPDATRARVLAAIEGMPQVDPGAAPTPARVDADTMPGADSGSDADSVRDADPVSGTDTVPGAHRMPQGRHHVNRRMVSTGRTLRFTRRTAAMLAASLVVLGALVVGGITVRTMMTPTGSSPQAVAQVRDAADARTARASIAGGGTATVTWSDAESRSVLAMADAEATPSGRTYQLWYITGGKARSAGLFAIGASGHATAALDGRMRSGDVIAVTVEPAGGSAHPTTKPIVAVDTA